MMLKVLGRTRVIRGAQSAEGWGERQEKEQTRANSQGKRGNRGAGGVGCLWCCGGCTAAGRGLFWFWWKSGSLAMSVPLCN